MSAYVDDMRRAARPAGYRGRGTPRWSHLMADTTEELLDLAHRLGLNSAWLQHAGRPTEHFDVTDTVRTRAIQLGAIPIKYGRQGGLLSLSKGAAMRGDDEAAHRYRQEFDDLLAVSR